jgi:fumarate hydratase, class II
MDGFRIETDSLGEVKVPAGKLWGAQTQRSIEHFSIGKDIMPDEMITAFALLKKAAARVNFAGGRLDAKIHNLIVQVCDEILGGQHHDMFPLHVWMTGRAASSPARRSAANDPSTPMITSICRNGRTMLFLRRCT